jgi:hypothetical protein
MTYMESKVGQCKAPLTFVLRENDKPGNAADCIEEYDRMIYLTPLMGEGFRKDSGTVYDELKSLLINSPAFTWIRPFDHTRNGRAAWKELLNHYEGTTEQTKVKEAAYATIHNASYSGEKRNWTFEQYYHTHQEAYYDLETYGDFITESKKVTDFLRGISDPMCQVAKGIVIATPTYFNNFTEAAQYIASTLNITLSVNRDRNCNIGSTTTNNGRAQGGKNNRKGNKKQTHSYSPAKWRALSKEEKK